jgi:hypothetical protein
MRPSFAVERTLGKLAKWLRILGFDTLYEGDLSADETASYHDPQRISLTRTERVRRRPTPQRRIFIEPDDPDRQLQQVIRAVGIRREDLQPFSRCILCNTPLAEVEKSDVKNRVPDYVWETQASFRRCPSCRRIYWAGSHIDRGLKRIQALFYDAQSQRNDS